MRVRKVFINLLTIVVLICFSGCYEEKVIDENLNITDVEDFAENEDVEFDDVADVDEVENVAEGTEISDVTASEAVTEGAEVTETEEVAEDDVVDVEYIGNKSSLKFHYPWCHSAERMKESNRVYFYGSREEVVEDGYNPCKNCNP